VERNPELSLTRVQAELFSDAAAAVLAVVDPADVDLVSPVLQAISVAARPLALAAYFASGFFALLLVSRLAQASINPTCAHPESVVLSF